MLAVIAAAGTMRAQSSAPESPRAHHAADQPPVYRPLLDDVRPSRFQTITPGETAEVDVEKQLGKALERRETANETFYTFRVGSFSRVEVVAHSGVVVRIVVSLPEPVALHQVVQELGLRAFLAGHRAGRHGANGWPMPIRNEASF